MPTKNRKLRKQIQRNKSLYGERRMDMQMKRIEADTLEEAYSKAAQALSCSVTEINYEIVQYPTSGVMGLFKKTAIIVAVKKSVSVTENSADITALKEEAKKEMANQSIVDTPSKPKKEKKSVKEEGKIYKTPKVKQEKVKKTEVDIAKFKKKDEIVDNFFSSDETPSALTEETHGVVFDDDRDAPENRERAIEIEGRIKKLMEVSCFEIDTVEVDVFNGIAHIFIDGEDAALLIGKEGYRYNALSYMLFNWINAEYDLYIKLEIAEFIQAQEEMIDNYLKPIAEHILVHGKGKTKPLDGILVQIALEKLRAMFPNKYIAIKTGKDGKKFIIINDFNTKKRT